MLIVEKDGRPLRVKAPARLCIADLGSKSFEKKKKNKGYIRVYA